MKYFIPVLCTIALNFLHTFAFAQDTTFAVGDTFNAVGNISTWVVDLNPNRRPAKRYLSFGTTIRIDSIASNSTFLMGCIKGRNGEKRCYNDTSAENRTQFWVTHDQLNTLVREYKEYLRLVPLIDSFSSLSNYKVYTTTKEGWIGEYPPMWELLQQMDIETYSIICRCRVGDTFKLLGSLDENFLLIEFTETRNQKGTHCDTGERIAIHKSLIDLL